MNMPTKAIIVSTVALAVLAGPALAQQSAPAKVGTLNCDISGGIGMIVASKKQVTCMFTPSAAGPK